MDERFEQLSSKAQELVNILGIGKSSEFAAMLKREVHKEVDNDEALIECPPDMRDDYAQYLATIAVIPSEVIAFMYLPGFKDGFCACLRCLSMCDDRGLGTFSELYDSLQKEAEAMTHEEKLRAKVRYMKERIC